MDFKKTQIGRLLTDIKLAMMAHSPIVNIVTNQLEIINQLLWDKECVNAIIPQVKYDSSSGEYKLIAPEEGYEQEETVPCNYYIGKFPKIDAIETPVLVVNFTTEWKLIKESATAFVKAYLGINNNRSSLKTSNFINQSVYLVVTPNYATIPADLAPYVCTIYLQKMEDEEIAEIIKNNFKENDIDLSKIPATLLNQMVVNFRGFGKNKIKQILNKCMGIHYLDNDTINGKSVLKEIRLEKKQLLKGCKGLKWENTENTNIAGLKAITQWLDARIELFSDPEKAIKQHIDIPRGIIIAGIPGSGKSLMAKSAAHILGIPLVSLDMGALLGSLVGDSEHNMIEALQIAEKMAPCILWIDEIEKAFSGSSLNASHSDGGVGRRMFGKFLTWMQEKSTACFVFATSNDVTALPPELFRSERFDRKFFTFMPTAEECAEIFASNIQKQNIEYKREISHLNFIQGLETPEYLFEPELENSRFWLQFINDSCGSVSASLSLEENTENETLPLRYGWKEGKRPNFKLMTGADIAAIIKSAKFECYQNNKNGEKISTACVYNTNSFLQSIRNLLMSEEFKPYGETNLKDIVKCFLKLYENQFASASGNCIVHFDEYDPENRLYLHNPQRTFEYPYDQALYYAIVGAINHYMKTLKTNES